MKTGSMVMVGLAVAALTLAPIDGASAAQEENCLDSYLLCLNDASQEESGFWRTLRETECGAGYYGCMRKKLLGA